MDDMILYHGSRGGIHGSIMPLSRKRCDFGQGFYMGTNAMLAKSIVAGDTEPYYYELKVKLSDISEDKVLQLDGMDWAYFVLYNRGRLEKIKGTSFYKKYEGMGRNKDFVVGPIADDNMSRVINKFVNDEITDKALLKSISSIDYGIQYVAKTEYACSKIECVYEEELSPEVTIPLILENAKRRQAGLDAASDMLYEYRRKGRYFSEVLQKYINKNVTHKLFSR